jgi:hypothetical protein
MLNGKPEMRDDPWGVAAMSDESNSDRAKPQPFWLGFVHTITLPAA